VHLVGGVMVNGCHHDIGTARLLPKLERRTLEAELSRLTREAVIASGNWPKRLPMWSGS
jgi:hypothetical protein